MPNAAIANTRQAREARFKPFNSGAGRSTAELTSASATNSHRNQGSSESRLSLWRPTEACCSASRSRCRSARKASDTAATTTLSSATRNSLISVAASPVAPSML